MQRTKSKILSILLSLVMLLSLLPTTALATTYNDVKVNGVSLGDGEYLTSNAATAASISSTEPTTYVAWYKNGVLTLNNFTGKSNSGIVLQGAPAADLIIKLIGNNTITPYDTGIQGNSAAGSITITADSGSNGKLTINMPNSERSAFGINGSANSVTISGSADVTIIATATATNQESYGIKSSKAVSILDSASVNITCKTPNSTSRSDSCNGIYSDTGVTINTDGTIQIDVHEAGDEAYSYGINSMGTLTLTKVGGMTVKWKKAGVQGSPLLPSSASFDPTAYDTHMDTTDTTNCTATYMPKGTATTGDLPVAITKPVKGGTPETTITGTNYTGSITWDPTVSGTFAANTEYTAKVELTANTGYQFASDVNPTVTDATISEKSVSADGKTLTFKATFPETDSKTLKGIDIITNPALTLAVPTAAPNATATNERSLAVTGVYDDGSGGPVAVNWKITTDPIPTGVSLDGSTLKVTNEAEAGQVRIEASSTEGGYTDAEFVTITKDTPVESAIVLTPPTSTTVEVPKSDTPNEIDLPTATVYDQYGKPMTGTFSITYEIVDTAPTGVTLNTAGGKMKVKRFAQAGVVEIVGKLTTTAGTVTSDPVTYTITRETSQVTSVRVNAPEYLMDVPKVTEPGTPNQAYQQFNAAKVLDQYGQEMTGQTVTWSVADDAGNPVTGVSIDTNGKLTVTNEAPAITVYVTATCSGIVSNKSKVTLSKETAKDSFVKICNQVGDAPETSILIPTGSIPRSEDYTAKVYDQYGKETAGMVNWALDKTYTGVELDTLSIPGSATLKVENTATPGTIRLIATCSTVGSTASKTLDITLTKKTVDTTSLTVTQADTTYGTALADPVFTKPEGTIKTLVHYSTPTSSGYSSDTPPTNAGEYVVNVVCETATHIYMGHADFKIEPKSISNMLQDITGTYVYDGTPKKPTAVVMDGTKPLVEGTDYTVSYGTNVHVFEAATVYVEGKGNYTGTFSRNFKIQPKPIDIEDVSTTNRDYEEGRLDVDCTVKLPVASDVKQGEHYHVYATMADDTAGTNKTVNVLVKMEKGGLGENYTLNKDTTTATVTINQINPADPTGLKGVKGQELSTVELPAGWNWDAPATVMNTAGTQTFKAHYAGDANHKAVTGQAITVNVLDKTDVSTFITFPDGEKEYTGSWMEYKEATISGTNLGTGAKWDYVYTAGTGTLLAGYPQGIGTYTVTATYEDSLNFGIATATLTITAKKVAIPAADTTAFTYDGNAKTYGIADTADYTVTGNSQTNAGDHTVTVALKDKATTAWADGTTADKTYTFTIKQATPTGEPAYTKITTSGKKLSDAALTTTGGTFSVPGTVKWVDDTGAALPGTTTVEANKLYKWVFTPSDSTNYESINGSIKLWSKSTSSGGGGSYYAPVVPDMPMVYWGCTGDAVKALQEKLNAKGFNSGNVDGIFGAKTYAAVTAFQKANSLGVDGIVGKLTWAKLYDATPVNVTPVTTQPMLRTGSRGDAVRKLQELLNAKGYTCGSVDGIFGSKTYAAVLAFQKANGLGADGIVGSLTWGKLV